MPDEVTTENAEITAGEQQKPVIGKPFEKGQSGNPAGRPVGAKSLTTKVKEALAKLGGAKIDGVEVTYEEALIKKIMHKAIVEGDPQMIKLMWNYIDGMPMQNMNLTASDIMNPLTSEQKAKLDKLLGNDETEKQPEALSKAEAPDKQSGAKADGGGDAPRPQVPGQ